MTKVKKMKRMTMSKRIVLESLKQFDEIVKGKLETVCIIDDRGRGPARKATAKDNLEFIREQWQETLYEIADAGYDIEEV